MSDFGSCAEFGFGGLLGFSCCRFQTEDIGFHHRLASFALDSDLERDNLQHWLVEEVDYLSISDLVGFG